MSRLARHGNILLFAGSMAVIFLLLEGGLRLVGISYPYWSRVDPLTGFSPRPGISGWVHDEGDAFVEINDAGFRDREHVLAKPPRTLRIAVLGDSMTEARQVNITETFWSILEQKLQTCSVFEGVMPEVLNFGVSGYGTAQQYLLLERVWPYEPDIVLLAFYPGNDVLNNSFELEGSTQKPYVEEKDGALVPDFSFRETPFFRKQNSRLARSLFWMIDHSRTAQVVSQALQTARRFRVVRETQQSQSGTVLADLGLDPNVHRPPTAPAYRNAWSITERLLSAMSRQTEERGAYFALAVIPLPEAIHPDSAMRAAKEKAFQVNDLFYAEDRIYQLGAKEGFPVFALGRRLQRAAEENKTFFNGFPRTEPGVGHLNVAGHAEAGMLLSRDLCQWMETR